MFTRPDNWNELSPLERRKARLDAWQNAPVEFAIRVAEPHGKVSVRPLDGQGFDDIGFVGEYPVATVHYGTKKRSLAIQSIFA